MYHTEDDPVPILARASPPMPLPAPCTTTQIPLCLPSLYFCVHARTTRTLCCDLPTITMERLPVAAALMLFCETAGTCARWWDRSARAASGHSPQPCVRHRHQAGFANLVERHPPSCRPRRVAPGPLPPPQGLLCPPPSACPAPASPALPLRLFLASSPLCSASKTTGPHPSPSVCPPAPYLPRSYCSPGRCTRREQSVSPGPLEHTRTSRYHVHSTPWSPQ